MGDNWKTYANVLTKIGYRVHLLIKEITVKAFGGMNFPTQLWQRIL